RYGFWRPVIAEAVEKFLTCGDLHEGFARIRCPNCHHEMFVAFSCRRRCLCPSCHQKRALMMAADIAEDLCEPVPHRQFVFTIPKRLRIFFRFDRRLLGQLPRLAWQAVLEVYRAVLDRDDVVPGMVAAIHTFGQLLHHHCHIHALVTDGCFTPDGTFIPLPRIEAAPFIEIWRRQVFALLLRHDKITEGLVGQMMQWRHHCGFGIDRSVVLAASDTKGLERVARYMLRCPLGLARLVNVNEQGQVIYRAERHHCHRFPEPGAQTLVAGVSRNFQVFEPLDFIAELTQHIPAPGEHLSRRFGWYANRVRGERAKNAANADARHEACPIDDQQTPDRRERRRRWAALIKRVYEVDPMVCPACGHSMTVVSFINPSQREVIRKILTHCGLHERSCRAPPPSTSPLHEATYVSDLEFADAPPPEPVWSAD
ncbi:MAG: transposase, partial [Acidobacteriota bacterium]